MMEIAELKKIYILKKNKVKISLSFLLIFKYFMKKEKFITIPICRPDIAKR